MDRRLQNNLTALAVSGAALVVALVAAAPLPDASPATPGAATITAGDEAASALIAALEQAGGAETHTHRRIAMPYFTFLPRG